VHKIFGKYGSPAIKLNEECCELAQVCMKIERFGLDDHNPLKKKRITNRQRLFDEIADVEEAIKDMKKWVATITTPQIFRKDEDK